MAIAVYSCLGPPSLPPLPKPTTLTKTSTIAVAPPRSERKEAVGWRSRWASTAACVVIGSAVGFGGGEQAVAGEYLRAVEGRPEVRKVMRWSDVRRCPPWHANSLENIVPENLPRPSSGGRRYNRVAAQDHPMAAPPVGSALIHYRGSSCFTL